MAESVTALNADVVWRTDTGQAERDIERLRRSFYESTNQMSTQTLRLQSAQERLDRALARHGTTSRQAREAEIALRRVMAETTVTAERESVAVGHAERSVERLGRGALVGSGHLRGLARSVAFASTSFLGGFGLVYALRTAVTAGEELEVSQRKLDTQLEANGESTERGRRILAALDRQMIDVGHTSTETAAAFTILDRSTGDAAKAAELMGLAADLAAAKHTTLEKAALIVAKVVNGNTGILKRNGVAVKDGATVTEALAAAQEKLAGQAKAAVTPQEQLHAAIVNTEAAIGKDLLPTVQRLETQSTKWLSSTENQRRIQRDVNEVVRDGEQVVHGLADAFRIARQALGPVVGLLGGAEAAARDLGIAFLLLKARGYAAAAGIRTAGTAAVVAEGEMVAAGGTAAGLGAQLSALTAAPYVLTVLVAYKDIKDPGSIGRRGRSLLDSIKSGGLIEHGLEALPTVGPLVAALHNALNVANVPGGRPTIAPSSRPGQDTRDRQPGRSPRGPAPPGPQAPSSRGRHHRRGLPHGFTVPQHFLVDEARAAAEGTKSDVLRIDRAELAYVRAEIAAGHLNKAGLIDAYNEERRLEDSIDSLVEHHRKHQAARVKKRHDATVDAIRKTHVTDSIQDFLDAELRHQALTHAKKRAKIAKSSAGSLYDEAAEEFRVYGSNIAGPGGILSPQDARAGFAAAILAELQEGNRLARERTRAAKTTAKHTGKIGGGPNPAKVAAALAEVGAWT